MNPRRRWVIRPSDERLNRKYVKAFKSAQIRIMVCVCFTDDRIDSLIVCDERGIDADEYEDILYDDLFSLVDDSNKSSKDPETIQVVDENIFIFM